MLVAGCDARIAATPGDDRTRERGPSRDAFGDRLYDSPEALVATRGGGEGNHLTTTVEMVPLVFDANGQLHTPISYRALVEEIMGPAGTSELPPSSVTHPPVQFTDRVTFRSVISSGFSTPTSRPLSEVYSGAQWIELSEAAAGEAPAGAAVMGYDIYVPNASDARTPAPCVVEVGDECGTPGGGAGNQHSGGTFTDDLTTTMEAIGKKDDACIDIPQADQVQERPARTWFNRSVIQRTALRHDHQASWSQRATAVMIARVQNPDSYSIFTRKTEASLWYCSKLVWFAYRRATGRSLDPDWGFWVTPHDLTASGNLRTVLHYTRTR